MAREKSCVVTLNIFQNINKFCCSMPLSSSVHVSVVLFLWNHNNLKIFDWLLLVIWQMRLRSPRQQFFLACRHQHVSVSVFCCGKDSWLPFSLKRKKKTQFILSMLLIHATDSWLNEGVETSYSWNLIHFLRCGSKISIQAFKLPDDFPTHFCQTQKDIEWTTK